MISSAGAARGPRGARRAGRRPRPRHDRAHRPAAHRAPPPDQPGRGAPAGALAAQRGRRVRRGRRHRGHHARGARAGRTRARGSSGCGSTRSSPRTPRRPGAGGPSPPRCAGSPTPRRVHDDPATGPVGAPQARRRMLEDIDILQRTSTLRITPADPRGRGQDGPHGLPAVAHPGRATVPAGRRGRPRRRRPGRLPLPPVVRFGSWVGGDRDGNPFVTAEVTRETVATHADQALLVLHDAVDRVARMITVDEESTPPTARLRDALSNDAAAHPRLLAEVTKDSPTSRTARSSSSSWPGSRRPARSGPAWPTPGRRRPGGPGPGAGLPRRGRGRPRRAR